MAIIFFTGPTFGSFRRVEDRRLTWPHLCSCRLERRLPCRDAPLCDRCWALFIWATITPLGFLWQCRSKGCFMVWWSLVAGNSRFWSSKFSIFRWSKESSKTSDCLRRGIWREWVRFPPSCLHSRPKRTCCSQLYGFCMSLRMKRRDRSCWSLIYDKCDYEMDLWW